MPTGRVCPWSPQPPESGNEALAPLIVAWQSSALPLQRPEEGCSQPMQAHVGPGLAPRVKAVPAHCPKRCSTSRCLHQETNSMRARHCGLHATSLSHVQFNPQSASLTCRHDELCSLTTSAMLPQSFSP